VMEDDERKGRAEFGVYEAPFEVVIENVNSSQVVRCTEYEPDKEDSPLHPDNTVFGEPYGIAGRPPVDIEYIAVGSKSNDAWLLAANVDRPAVGGEGDVIIYDMYDNGGTWEIGSKIELAGDIKLNPRAGKKTYTTGATYLGSDAAAEEMLLGKTVHANIGQFLGSWNAHLTALIGEPPIDDAVLAYATDLQLAIGVLLAAMDHWKSVLHKLDQ